MLIITQKQMDELNEVHLSYFVKKMQTSIIDNLGIEYAVKFDALKKVTKKAINDYHFVLEARIEDFLLLYSQFPVFQKEVLPDEIEQILLSRTKKEGMKIEELTEYVLLNK